MLESMTVDETPTRAEATDVANAVWDGTSAVMLSGETAVGRHPLLVLGMMDRIVRAAESSEATLSPGGHRHDGGPGHNYAAAVTHAAQVLAEDVDAAAIVSITRTGLTAQMLSRSRARTPIFAFTPDAEVARRLALWWGVTPVPQGLADGLESNIEAMERYLLEHRSAAAGDTIVIAGSHPLEPGVHTNFVKYHVLDRQG
jgi:pyruvate kinase